MKPLSNLEYDLLNRGMPKIFVNFLTPKLAIKALPLFEYCGIIIVIMINIRIRFNSELYETLNGIDIVQHINIQRLRWLGNIARMKEDASARRVFYAGICDCRRRGPPCMSWKNQIKEVL